MYPLSSKQLVQEFLSHEYQRKVCTNKNVKARAQHCGNSSSDDNPVLWTCQHVGYGQQFPKRTFYIRADRLTAGVMRSRQGTVQAPSIIGLDIELHRHGYMFLGRVSGWLEDIKLAFVTADNDVLTRLRVRIQA
ncbi:hypothetical protein NQ317_007830 [Molorchus minor]|uniref:Transposase n=1 Tax=Molorchus minor TaxID=1323400 RepID=A0ABQ9K3Q6_9CUCU|nr:hypothetical protein NQ317_007830 [Molorchus minor]